MGINFEPGVRIEQKFFEALANRSDLNTFRDIKNEAKSVLRDQTLLEDQEQYILNIINVVNEVIISKKMEGEALNSPLKDFYEVTLNTSKDIVTSAKKQEEPISSFSKALEKSQQIYNDVIQVKPGEQELSLATEVLYDLSYYGGLSLVPPTESDIKGDYNHLPAIQMRNVLHDQYSAIHNTPNAVFTEGRIYGDGNCGFSATNTTREEVVQHLNAHAGDAVIREMVAPEIMGWLKTTPVDELPEAAQPVMQNYWDNNAAGIDIPEYEEHVQNIAASEPVFRYYVNTYYDKGRGYLVIPDHGAIGVINVIAAMKNIQVRVWKPQPQGKDALYLHGVYGESKDKEHTINIIHRMLHFNKLLPSPAEYDAFPAHNLADNALFSPLAIY